MIQSRKHEEEDALRARVRYFEGLTEIDRRNLTYHEQQLRTAREDLESLLADIAGVK